MKRVNHRMKRLYKIFAFLTFAFLLAGCNNSIFLDEPNMPEETYATIEGDGGEVTFKIPLNGLEHFGFDLFSESEKYCKYFNLDGDVIDKKSPASEVSRILFETDFTKIEIVKDGSGLKVISTCQTSQYEGHWSIRLEYSYGVRFIDIEVLPGKPLKRLGIDYPDGITVCEKQTITTDRFGYNNNGPVPQTYEIRPYLNEFFSILVEPDRNGSWIKNDPITMEVPYYENGIWQFKQIEGIRPGDTYKIARPDRKLKVDVEIPANFNVDIFTDIIYTRAEANGVMTFFNEILDRRINVFFKVTSRYPENYEIRINEK